MAKWKAETDYERRGRVKRITAQIKAFLREEAERERRLAKPKPQYFNVRFPTKTDISS